MADISLSPASRQFFEAQARRDATSALPSSPVTPDEAAESMRVAEELGIPSQVVQSGLPTFKAEAQRKKDVEALRMTPATRDWLRDVNNGAIAADDIENASWFERAGRSSLNAIRRGGINMTAVPDVYEAQSISTGIGDVGKTENQILAEIIAPYGVRAESLPPQVRVTAMEVAKRRFEVAREIESAGMDTALQAGAAALSAAREKQDRAAALERSPAAQRFQDETLANAENTFSGVFKAFMADPIGGISFVAETAAEMVPALAAATATTTLTRSPAAGVAVMAGNSFLLENTSGAMELLSERGYDLSDPEQALAAIEDRDLMEEAGRRGFTRGIVIALFDAVSGGIAGKQITASPVGEMILQPIIQGGMGAGGEAAAQKASGQEFSAADIVLEGLAEVVTAPIEVVGVAGRGTIREFVRAREAGKTKDALTKIGEMATASKVRERSVDMFENLLESADAGVFYVPASDLVTFYQAKDMSDDAAAEAYGYDADALSEALATGGDVALPVSRFAGRVAGTEDAAWFVENATLSPDEMSANEARLFNEKVADVVQDAIAQAERAFTDDLEKRSGDVQAYDRVYEQLRAAGRTPDVADAEARVLTAFFRTMSERMGEGDAIDLYRRFGLDIRGPEQQVARSRGALDIALNTIRSGRMPKPGRSLSEFVKDKGGIQDNGDVAAMEPPAGIIAETAEEGAARRAQPSMFGAAAGKGVPIDEMARMAAEAGYFPDLMGEATGGTVGEATDMTARLLAELDRDLRGERVYVPGDEGDQQLEALATELDRRGLDVAAMSNDEIAAAMEEADGQTYNQDGTLVTDTPAFKAWFGDSKVVGENGDPLVVYHGTRDDFESFQDFSGGEDGFYFSSNPEVSAEYAGPAGGRPDEADGQVMPVYLSLKNPLIVDWGSEIRQAERRGVRVKSATMFNEQVFNDLLGRAEFEGRDGLIVNDIMDGWDDGSQVGTTYVAFSPEQIKSVYNRGTFDPADPRILYQEKRGSIEFPRGGLEDGQTVINLFEASDLSTFLHESGHYFLEAFNTLASDEGAPADIKADMAAIRKFVGAEEGKPFTREQHEKWARGFEAYALEGKAPSLELADAFSRFKAWLTRIYRSIAGLNVKLNPEIRDVMDRMLATEREITAAREAQQMDALFTDQAAAGMSDAAWRTYQRLARRSREEADQKLLAKTMERIRREKQAWWKEERAAVRKDVESQVNSRREFRLIEMMANQQWIGSDKDVPDFQIDRQQLVDMFGAGVIGELSRSRFGGKRAIYGPDGVSPEEAADFFGFASAEEMVKVLQNTGKRKDTIEAETDRVMLDRYGDPLTDGSIEQEALEAIHSEQQAKSVSAEIRHLSERAGLPTRNLTAKVFRARAKLMLGRMTVREATRPEAFLKAERQASKRAEEAFARVAKGDDTSLAIAARHKEQQLLNHYLYLESRDFSRMVASKREKMQAYRKKSVRQKLWGDYIEQIDALLVQYDFRKRSPGQVARDQNLTAFVERMKAEGRMGEVNIDERIIRRAKATHYSNLSADELVGLFDTIENIDHLGRTKQKLIDAKEQRDLEAIANKIRASYLDSVSGEPPSRTPTPGDTRKRKFREILNYTLNADTLLREADGWQDNGTAWTEIKSPIDQALGRVVERRIKMAKDFDAIYDKYSLKEKREMSRRVQNDDLGVSINKWELIALALNTGNEDNFDRLTNPKNAGSFRREAIEAALSKNLDKRDWETVQSIWNYINSFWGEIEQKARRQTGTAPTKVPAKVMVNAAPGFVTGGYYPIKYDNRLSALTEDFDRKELADQLMGGMFGKAQTANGHTKERATTTTQAVSLSLGVAHNHVERVIYDLEVGEPAANAWRILQDQRVRSAFLERGRQADHQALELWLQDVAAGERVSASGWESVLRYLRNGFTISRLAFNLGTVMLQPSGIFQSAVVVGKKDMARGVFDFMSDMRGWQRKVEEASSIMRERQTTFERDIFNVVGDLEDGPVTGRWQKFQRDVLLPASFYMMQKVQYYSVDLPTWVAAYQKEIRLSGDEAKARTYADMAVKRAQGSGLMSDRGMLERGTTDQGSRQRELPRLFTALGSYMFAKGNVAYEKIAGTDWKDPLSVISLTTDIALLFTLEALVSAAVAGFLPEDDEDTPEEWMAWLAKETAFSALATLPFARDLVGAFEGFGSGGAYGSITQILTRPAVQMAQGEFDKAAVKAAIDSGGMMFHLPSSQLRKTIEGMYDADMRRRDEVSIGTLTGVGQGSGRSIADFLFQD